MNRSIFWRLVWKEYRLQRGLWIAMAVLTAAIAGLAFKLAAFGHDANAMDQAAKIFVASLALPAFYLLGSGAMLFASERESRTYEFQRGLPVSARRLFCAKIVFSLGSAALMFALLLLPAMWLDPRVPTNPIDPHASIVMHLLLAVCFGLEMFLWALFFSLVCGRVIIAAVFGVAAASATAELYGNLYNVLQGKLATLPVIVVITLLVAIADVRLGLGWFHEKRPWRPLFGRRKLAARTESAAIERACPGDRPGGAVILVRLVWQHWRQSARTMLAISSLAIPLAAMGYWIYRGGLAGRGLDNGLFCVMATVFFLPAIAPLLGACAFSGDQTGCGFRFLAVHGVSPRCVWLSRLLLPLTFSFAIAPVLSFVLWALFARSPDSELQTLTFADVFPHVLGYMFLGFSAGQFIAIIFRSSLLAGLFSLLLTAPLTAWCALMIYLGVGWWWSALPIPLALLLATRLRVADWLIERNSPRAWRRPAFAILIPTAALLTAVPLYRAYEFPRVDPGFSLEEFCRPLTPEERATLDLYRQASAKLVGPQVGVDENEQQRSDGEKPGDQRQPIALDAWTKAFVDTNQVALSLALKASRQESVHDDSNAPGSVSDVHAWELYRLLINSATKLEEEGKLDTALEHYLATIRFCSYLRRLDSPFGTAADPLERAVYDRLRWWAVRPQQTPERLLTATRQLEQLVSDMPPGTNWIKREYTRVRRFVAGDLVAIEGSEYGVSGPANESAAPLTAFWLWLPWERTRAVRLLNLLTRRQLEELSEAESDARAGRRIAQAETGLENEPSLEPPYVLQRAVTLPPLQYDPDFFSLLRGTSGAAGSYAAIETCRRAMILTLALEAWKLRHGSLPNSLNELVGSCLKRLPIDPYSGEPFRYVRGGLKTPLRWRSPGEMAFREETTAPNTPFLWSTGPNVAVVAASGSVVDRYRINRDAKTYLPINTHPDHWRKPESEREVWQAGWAFPIP
ncbi:MAG: hypothetical protein ABFC96_13760 [Thermoguttaceae bacterium]